MSPPEPSISKLLLKIRDGDREAREQLFSLLADEKQFGSVLMASARKLLPRSHPARRLLDSQDVVQSALRTGLRQFSEFRGESETKLYAWLRAIIRTKVSRVRGHVAPPPERQRRLRAREEERAEGVSAPLSEIVDQELKDGLYKAVAQLPLSQRLVVELRLRGFNSFQIAGMLRLNPATVRKRESRAVETLKEMIQGDDEDTSHDESAL